jgi:hypothetical protein
MRTPLIAGFKNIATALLIAWRALKKVKTNLF